MLSLPLAEFLETFGFRCLFPVKLDLNASHRIATFDKEFINFACKQIEACNCLKIRNFNHETMNNLSRSTLSSSGFFAFVPSIRPCISSSLVRGLNLSLERVKMSCHWFLIQSYCTLTSFDVLSRGACRSSPKYRRSHSAELHAQSMMHQSRKFASSAVLYSR